MLFIDARNYYTVVDRTLNEWSEWQLKNLNAIVWLYRGEADKYRALVEEYAGALGNRDFAAVLETAGRTESPTHRRGKRSRRGRSPEGEESGGSRLCPKVADTEASIVVAKEALWLTEKFGKGEYADIPGLCKVATLEEIEAKGYSLTPGAYVGVAPAEDDGVDFHERMTEIHKELLSLQEESNRLMETISKNWEEMGL